MLDMAVDNEVRDRLQEWLASGGGDEEWLAFEEWFVSASWDDDSMLIREVNALLSESGLMSETERTDRAQRAVSTVWLGDPVGTVLALSVVTVVWPITEVGGDHTIRRRLELAGT